MSDVADFKCNGDFVLSKYPQFAGQAVNYHSYLWETHDFISCLLVKNIVTDMKIRAAFFMRLLYLLN